MNKRHSAKIKKIPTPTLNSLRIIGGQWRSRKISFPSTEGRRPSPDRIRETLFNWLR
jgi:16S rRNA (guanine966-N2)-methyltransferase